MTDIFTSFLDTFENFIAVDSNIRICDECEDWEIISDVTAVGALSEVEDESLTAEYYLKLRSTICSERSTQIYWI